MTTLNEHQQKSLELLKNQEKVANGGLDIKNTQTVKLCKYIPDTIDNNSVNTQAIPIQQPTDKIINPTPILERSIFTLYDTGLLVWVKSWNDKEKGDFKRIGNYIYVVAKSTLDGICCLLLEFTDSDNGKVDFILECGELVDSRVLSRKLLNAGYKMDLSYQKQLQTYLSEFNPEKNIIATKQIGWLNGNFVLPDRVIGNNGDVRYYGNLDTDRFKQCGILEEWRQNVAMPCAGSEILEISLYAGFSSMLVDFVGFGFGLHYSGSSSTGKTTALRVASSIFGRPSGYMHKWNATHNGMEFIGYNSNNVLCAIDEVNEAAKSTLDSIYMLVDGMGKSRATSRSNGVSQAKVKTWCTVILSSGETSIEDLAMQFGKNLKAGESVRMLDIAIIGKVCKDKIHADMLNDNCAKYYGTAVAAFIEHIQINKIDVKERFKAAYTDLTQSCTELHGQASRVAKDFALMRVAGDLTIEAGILPPEFKPKYYITKQFNQWHHDNQNNKEKQQILSVLAQAINDPQRFIPNDPDSRATSQYIGFYDNENWYLVPSLVKVRLWIPKGINPKLAKAVLEHDGFISAPIHQPIQRFSNNAQRKVPRLDKKKIDELVNIENEK